MPAHAEMREAFKRHVNGRIGEDPRVGPHRLGDHNFSSLSVVKADPALDHVSLVPLEKDTVRLNMENLLHWRAVVTVIKKNHFTRIATSDAPGSGVQLHVTEKAFDAIKRLAEEEPPAPVSKAKEIVRQRINELLPATSEGAQADWHLGEGHENFNKLRFVLSGSGELEEGKNALTLDLSNTFHFSAANSTLSSRDNFTSIRTRAEPGSDVHIVLPEERFRVMLAYIQGHR